MNHENVLRLKYAELCRELGHLCSNRSKIEKRIQEVEAEISALDRLAELPKKPEVAKEPAK